MVIAIDFDEINICGIKNIHLYQKIFKNKQTFKNK